MCNELLVFSVHHTEKGVCMCLCVPVKGWGGGGGGGGGGGLFRAHG